MIPKSHAFLAIFTSLFLGCGATAVTVSDDYSRAQIAPERLAVFLFPPKIDLAINVSDFFGKGVAQDAYAAYFAKEFPDALDYFATIGSIQSECGLARFTFVDKLMMAGSTDTLNLKFPREGATVRCDSVVPDFLLIINEMNISAGPMDLRPLEVPGKTKPDWRLVHRFQFLLWDNTKHKPAAFGKLSAAAIYKEPLSKMSWDMCLQEMARSIAAEAHLLPSPRRQKAFTK